MTAVSLRLTSTLRARWKPLLVLTLLFGVFAGVVLAAAAGARRTATAYPRFTEKAADYDVFLVPEEAVDHLTGPLYDEVARLPQVRRSARISQFQIYGLTPEGTVDQFFAAAAVSTDGQGRFPVGNPKLLAGRLPRPDQPDEGLVNRYLADRLHVGPGGSVTMRVFRGPLLENPAVADVGASEAATFRVTGVGVFPHDVVPGNLLDSIPRLYLTAAGAKAYGDPVNLNYSAMLIQLQPGTDMAEFRERVEAIQARYPEIQGDLNFGPQAGRRENTERAIRPQSLALGLFSLLAGVTSLFVLGQLLVREMTLEADEHPVLGALGLSRRNLFALSMAPALLVAVGGALLATGVAVAASPMFPIGPARLAEPHPGPEANVGLLVSGALVVVIALVARTAPAAARLATLPGATHARTSAWTDRAPRRTAGDVAAAVGLRPPAVVGTAMALPAGPSGRLGSERSAVVATAVALAGLGAALVFGANLERFVTTPGLYGQTWDESVDFQYAATPASDVLAALGDNPAVRGIAGGNYGVITLDGRQVPAVGIDALRGQVFPTILEGRAAFGPDEIVLGGSVLRQTGHSVGDEVDVGLGSAARRMHVVGRAVFPLLGQAGLEPTGLGLGAAVTADILGPAGPGVAVENYNFYLIDYRDGPRHRDGVRAAGAALESPCGGVCLMHRNQPPGDVVAYQHVRYTPLALAGLLVILTIATLDQSLVTSIRRRRRDLALLKSLGFVPRQVLATVSWQASTQVVLAGLAGLPLGIAAGRWAWVALARQLGGSPVDQLPALALAVMLLLPVLVANLVVLGPGLVAARTRPATVLRTE